MLRCTAVLRDSHPERYETKEFIVEQQLTENFGESIPDDIPTGSVRDSLAYVGGVGPFSPYFKGVRIPVAANEDVELHFFWERPPNDSIRYMGKVKIKPSGIDRDIEIPYTELEGVLGNNVPEYDIILIRDGKATMRFVADYKP
jgi:hypothetical protein